MKSIIRFLKIDYTLAGIYLLLALFATVQSLDGVFHFEAGGADYTKYNNYIIFKSSFFHLKAFQDLYILYPDEHWDLFKYTPSFAVFFGLFAYLPDAVGLMAWNVLNAAVLLIGVLKLPGITHGKKQIAAYIVLIEMMTSLQNEQSNALIAGCLLLAFCALENKRRFLGILLILATAFIKLFGIVALLILLCYPNKLRSFIYTLLATILLLIPPLLFIDINQYALLFESYLHMLGMDHAASVGFSFMAWLDTWFGIEVHKNGFVLVGAALMVLIPLFKMYCFKDQLFRMKLMAAILIWVVIFNHKAESPTFVIAMSGIALWYISGIKSRWDHLLLILAIIMTSLTPTDIFPRSTRLHYFIPYVVKVVPCVLIWIKIMFELALFSDEKQVHV